MIKKPAETEVEIAPLISERWSPRVFDPEFIIDEVSVKSILEAARWAPSCFGDQPWKFIIFQKKYNVSQAVDFLNQEFRESLEKKKIIDFLKKSNRGIIKGYF